MNLCKEHGWPMRDREACPECMLTVGKLLANGYEGGPSPIQGQKSLRMALTILRIPAGEWNAYIRRAETKTNYWHEIRELRRKWEASK